MPGGGKAVPFHLPNGEWQSLGGVQGALFKGRPCWGRQPQLPGAKPPHHPVGRKCAFDGRQAVKSAFALLSQKVTKAAEQLQQAAEKLAFHSAEQLLAAVQSAVWSLLLLERLPAM